MLARTEGRREQQVSRSPWNMAQGYSTQGYSTQGYSTQGCSTQGYSTQGYSTQGSTGWPGGCVGVLAGRGGA